MRYLLATVFAFFALFASAQFYSQGDANFSTTTNWDTNPGGGGTDPIASDFTDGNAVFIIQDGHNITITNAVVFSISSIQIGEGGAASSITFGDGTGNAVSFSTGSVTVQSNGTVQSDNPGASTTHTFNISGDFINNGGTLDLTNNNGVVNTTFNNSTTIVMSGSGTNNFNNISVDGGGNIINTLPFTVEGDFSVGATQSGISFSASGISLTFEGGFTLANSATFTTSGSTTTFNGAGAQAINLAGGTATFNNILFDNSTKTITGNTTSNRGIFTSGGTIEIADDAIITDAGAGNIHTFYNLEVKNQNGVDLTGSTVNFMGGEIRFGDNVNSDGTIDFGIGAGGAVDGSNDVDWVLVEGNTFIERDDQIIVDGDITVQGAAQFIINGVDIQVVDPDPAVNEVDATITADDTHTFSLEQNGDLYCRGSDNFPTTFGTYSFAPNSIVRYDSNFDQTIHGEEDDGTVISFARVLLDDDLTTKTLAANEDLTLTDQLNINGGSTFSTSSEVNIIIGGNITNGGANANFTANSATLTINGTQNQTLDAFDGSGDYSVRKLIISNPGNSVRTVNIDDDVILNSAGTTTALQSLFQIENDGGSQANILTVDLDANTVFGSNLTSRKDELDVGPFTSIFTSGLLFASDFNTSGSADVSTFDINSTVRFDSGTPQTIPNISGSYGNIEFNGNGDKYISSASTSLTIAGDVTRIGGAFVFNLDQFYLDPPGMAFGFSNYTINIGGDWNMTQASTAVNGEDGTVNFTGANQQISASDFENVVFDGSGTKTIQGALVVDGDLSLPTSGVTVSTSSNIDIQGNWSEATGALFQQDGGTTTFLGGTTQTISTQANSYFYDLDVELAGTILQLASTSIRASRDFDLVSPATLDLDGADDAARSLRVGRNALFDNGSTLSFANTSASIILDGDIAQNLDNEYNSGETYPTLEFEGVGEKDFIDQDIIVTGDFLVASGSTVNGNGERISMRGANWTVNGTFSHGNTVDFDGTTTTVSSSDFNDIEVSNGTTITLAGNINLEDDLLIEDGATLDAAGFSIQLEDNWTNFGTFTPGTGTVTFVGNGSAIVTQSSTDVTFEPQATAKAFYNLRVNNADGQDLVFEDDQIQDATITVLNDLVVESGNLRLNEDTNTGGGDGGPANATTFTLRVGADFIFSGGVLEYAAADLNTIELNGTSGGTHSIDLGGNVVREFQITGSDTYQLANTFEIEDDVDDEFVLSGTGTLDLNGQILIVNRGGFVMSDGVLEIDEGASMIMDGQAIDPDFDKTGGDIDLIGSAVDPATLTSLDASGFTFSQTGTGGDFEANNYIIAQTNGDGINIESGTITDFSEGTFTNGLGNAYLTLRNIDIATISAAGVAFNAGPTYNVSSDPLGTPPNSGSITFVIAGGTLSGSASEDDDGTDGGGFVRWLNEPGFTWNGSAGDGDWTNATNWTEDADVTVDINGNDIPDEATDVVYITNAGTAPTLSGGLEITIGRLSVNSGSVTLNSGELDVDGNFTLFSGATFTLTNATDSLKVAGSFANNGSFVQNSGKITFDGTGGTHSINSVNDFTNLNINGGSAAIYALGSALTVTDSISITGGTFDASSGFTFNVEGGWLVSGGTFDPGVGRVNFNGTSPQFISGGTLFNGRFSGAGTKTFVGNISFAGDLEINDGSGDVVAQNGSSILIFLGDDWDNDNTTAGVSSFTANDGTVILNGQGAQNIGGTQATTFNNITFQGGNEKNINTDITVNGDMTITSPTVDVTVGNTVTGTGGGTLQMSGGILDIEDTDNFPTGFGTVSLTGGRVRYFYADNTQIVRGGITYNDVELLSNGGADVITRTLGGDITVNGQLILGTGDVTFEAGGNTITITGDNAAGTNHFALGNDDIVTWTAGGRLIHSGSNEWDIDADLSAVVFEDFILSGGRKDVQGDLTINGDLEIGDDVIFDQNANAITNADGVGPDTFTLGANTSYFNDALGNSLPTGFDTYNVSSTSTTTLNAAGNQTLFTNGGTITYGALTINSDANVTLDGNVTIEGDFDMNDQPTLLDNDGGGPYNVTFNGSNVDIHDFVPTGTVTFAGTDQDILDNDGAADNLQFFDVVFAGSGTKTLNPNQTDEIVITNTLTINSGVSVTTADLFRFQGSTFTNNGSFSITDAGDPLTFDGTTVTLDPGTNDIAGLTLENTSTVNLVNSGLDIGNGDITVGDGSTLSFGNLTHNIAADDFFLNTTGMLEFGAVGSETTLIFDQAGGQNIPFIDATNNAAQITNIPNLTFGGTGGKDLTGSLLVNDIVLEASITDLDIDATNEYSIEVRGNWTNNGTNFVEREGIVTFFSNVAGADTKTITTAGDNFAEVIIDGIGGSDRTYTLVGDLVIEGEGSRRPGGIGTNEDALTLTRGTLDLNGNELTLGNNDGGDPTPEISVVGANGVLIVDDGAVLNFNTQDDDGDNGQNLDAAAVLQVFGEFHVDGSPGNLAAVTREAGGDRITITIESGATIEADNYSFSFLADAGLQVLDGASFAREDGVGTNTTFSNGSFNNLDNDAGPNTYLVIEADLSGPVNIDNVTFNFDGTPTVGEEFNVERSFDGGANNVITFSSTSGNLGNNGGLYENDGDAGQPDANSGRLIWPEPSVTTWQGTISNDWTVAGNWDFGVPSSALEAVIPLGNPFNPTYDLDAINENDTIAGISITNGILRLIDSDAPSADTLTIDGDFTVSATGTLITTADADLTVTGSLEFANGAVYDNGGITINLSAPSTTTPLFATGSTSVGSIDVVGDGDYQFNGADITIDNDFTVSGLASINPLDAGYDLRIGGDISFLPATVFNTGVDGEIILDGADQSVTNLDADELTLSGTGTKTLVAVSANDVFTVESGVTALGSGAISWEEDVIIDGTFNGADGIEYTFNGDDWIAGQNSYGNAFGTVIFNNNGGNTYIRQSTNAATDSVEFHNVILRGTANVELGRFINSVQEDGNVRMTGNMTVENTIGELRVNEYLIRNTTGTGTFTLQAGERIEVDGADNFPKDFGIYSIDATSTVAYEASFDQTIRGGFSYGNLTLNNNSTSSLNADIDINGDLFVLAGSTLDVTANNYTIRIAGRWDTENGATDGSFIARSGTVIFDGGANQVASIGNSGTQTFNIFQVDKSAGTVDLQNTDYVINDDLTIEDGTLDINALEVSIGGNLDISGSGVITSGAGGTLLFNASLGSPTIRTNGSDYPGNVVINAPGRTYTMLDDMIVNNVLTLTAGTLEVAGNTLEVGNAEDVINIFGTLNVSTTANPGGTLALGDQAQLVVQSGGSINIVGTASQNATVTNRGTGSYGFTVSGTGATPGNIAARFYLFEFMNTNGINIDANGAVNVTNNFSDGVFTNGLAGGTYLRIENDQEFLEASGEEIANVVFNDNPGGGAVNVAKTVGSTGVIEFSNYTGEFAGETFDSDPNNLIVWLDPTEILWTGTVSTDWFNASNWSTLAVPTIADDVVIPSSPTQATLNPPTIGNNTAVAAAANLTVETGNSLTINTSTSDAELNVAGTLTLETSSTFQSLGTNDTIRLRGSLILNGSPTFSPGSGSVFFFESESGLVTMNTSAVFNDFVMDVDGTLQLLTHLNVAGDYYQSDSSGVFDWNAFDVEVNGNFDNQNAAAGSILASTSELTLDPSSASTFNFDPGDVEYFDVILGDGTTAATYNLTGDLDLSNFFNLTSNTTLDLNGNGFSSGDSNVDLETVSINGSVTVGAGEQVSLGSGTVLAVNSGGNFQLSGASGNPAYLTRKGASGNYIVDIASGGEFGAEFFDVRYTGGDGIDFAAGSTLTVNSSGVEDIDPSASDGNDDIVLRNGSFANGAGNSYLRLANTFSGTYKSDNVVFSSGPVFNVSRNGVLNDIVFVDPSGTLQGPTYEDDDQNTMGMEATTGNVQWFFNNPLYTWTGATNSDFDDDANWSTVAPTGSGPGATNTVVIPDVSGGSNTYPTIPNLGTPTIASLQIDPSAQLTIDAGGTLTINEDFVNAGTIIINGDLNIEGTLTNTGTITAGASSTVTLNISDNITFDGGSSFNNLTFDADINTRVINTAGPLDVDGTLTITQGVLTIANATDDLTIGGDFVIDETSGGSFVPGSGTVILDGSGAQQVDNTAGGTINFNNLTLSGGSTKTLSDNTTINGDLILNDNSTVLELGSTTLSVDGDFTLNDGSSLSASTSTVEFAGGTTQRISGSGATTSVTFNNLTINNTSTGNDDIQLGIDVNVSGISNYVEGIISSTASNPIIFSDGSGVQYDGVAEVIPTGTATDGNSFVSGPVLKVGDDAFVFPVGDGNRIARMGISDLGNGGSATVTTNDRYSAQYFFGLTSNFSQPKAGGLERVSGLEYWDLSRQNGASEPAVTLFFDVVSEADDIPSLKVAHFTGGSWQNEGGTATAVPTGTITSNNFTSFSEVTLGTTDDAQNPLPVELLDFSGTVEDNVVTLNWSTVSELNNDFFEVQRSADGVTFEAIGTVEGNGTSSEKHTYSLVDRKPYQGLSYYRLRQVDFDGQDDLLAIIQIDNAFIYQGMTVSTYPNPTSEGNLNVRILTGDNHTPVEVVITDQLGRLIHSELIEASTSVDEKIIPQSTMIPGIYYMMIKQGNQSVQKKLIIK